MAKAGSKYVAAKGELHESSPQSLEEAFGAIRKVSWVKFDETAEIAMRLGVDPRHADQMVRGAVVLPHGLGIARRVMVIASGEKVREAEEAGAELAGGEDLVKRRPGGLSRLRGRGGHTRHDAAGGPARAHPRSEGPHAQPEVGEP